MRKLTGQFLVSLLLTTLVPSLLSAQSSTSLTANTGPDPEVDEIVNAMQKNQSRINSYSCDVEGDNTIRGKTVHMQYHLAVDLVNKKTHIIMDKSGLPMEMIFEGTTLYLRHSDGKYYPRPLTAEGQKALDEMLGSSLNSINHRDPRSLYNFKRNKGKDKGSLKALEAFTKGKRKMFHKMTQWVDMQTGIAMETELEDEKGNKLLNMKTNKVDKVHGISFVTEQETDADSPAGKVAGATKMKSVKVNEDLSEEFQK